MQSDFKVVVEMLKGNYSWCLEHTQLLNQCKRLLDEDTWETRITHCYREANQVTDKLTNLGLSRPLGCEAFQTPHVEISDLLYADGVGAVWLRQVNR